MLPQSAASPAQDTSPATAAATSPAAAVSKVNMLKFRRSRSSGSYSVTRPGQRQERHEDTGGPRDA